MLILFKNTNFKLQLQKLVYFIYRNFIYLFSGKGISFFGKLKLKVIPRFKLALVKIFNKPFKFTDSSSLVTMYEELFIKKIYEFNTTNDSPRIIDCGSNIGMSVLYFKERYPKSIIIAFEADPNIAKILKENIDFQGFENVQIINKAVWNCDGFISFNPQGGLSGSIGQLQEGSINIPTINLKNYLIEPIDFLKIDIEGAEYEVIMSIANDLKFVKNLFVEYHSFNKKPQKLQDLLGVFTNAGFRYYIQEASSNLQPFKALKKVDDMDLQLNIFCYR